MSLRIFVRKLTVLSRYCTVYKNEILHAILTHHGLAMSLHCKPWYPLINTLRPRQNGRHFADDTFKRFFLNVWILIKIPLKFVPKGPINNIPALVKIMAWRRPGDKPLSEPMMVSLLTHICVTRPQWVKVMASCLSDTKPLNWPVITKWN